MRTFLAIGRRPRIQGWCIAAGLALAGLSAPAEAPATFAGESGRIFFTAHAGSAGGLDVFSVNPDGSGLVNLTDLPGGPGEGEGPSVSGDGGRVAFTVGSQATSEVWAMNADGSDPERLTFSAGPLTDGPDQMPAISPDGSRIAFMTSRETVDVMPIGLEYDIWIMNSDGTDQRPLLHGTGESRFPEFTPGGDRVVMAHESSGDLDIAYVPATGGPFANATAVTGASSAIETTPSVRPDGTRIAFARQAAALAQADIQDAFFDGTDELPIAADPSASETAPAYSPDGTEIAYISGGEILIASTGGANPSPLPLDADLASSPSQLDWAPAEADGPAADTDPPQTVITREPKARSARRSARYRFESDEPGSSFECKLDRGRYAPCASPRRYRRLKARRHRFRVRAIDAAGNVDPTPARDRFRIVKPR